MRAFKILAGLVLTAVLAIAFEFPARAQQYTITSVTTTCKLCPDHLLSGPSCRCS